MWERDGVEDWATQCMDLIISLNLVPEKHIKFCLILILLLCIYQKPKARWLYHSAAFSVNLWDNAWGSLLDSYVGVFLLKMLQRNNLNYLVKGLLISWVLQIQGTLTIQGWESKPTWDIGKLQQVGGQTPRLNSQQDDSNNLIWVAWYKIPLEDHDDGKLSIQIQLLKKHKDIKKLFQQD